MTSQWSKRSPAARAKTLKKLQERRKTDPAFAAKNASSSKRWRQKNSEKCQEHGLKRRAASSPASLLWASARQRARKKGWNFDILPEDIFVPAFCPILGVPLIVGVGGVKPNSMSLDRIDSSRGYVRGNVMVVSFRANALKNNATLEEVELLYHHMKSLRLQSVSVLSENSAGQ